MEQVTQGEKRMSKVTIVEFFENIVYDMIEVIQDTEDMAGQELPGCGMFICFPVWASFVRIVVTVCQDLFPPWRATNWYLKHIKSGESNLCY